MNAGTTCGDRRDGRLQRRAQRRAAQVAGLAQRDELVGQGQLERVQHALELRGRQEAEGLHVLLAGRCVERVHGRRRRQQPALGAQPDDGLVQRHEAGLAAGVGRELLGQAREAVVQQPVQALLEQVDHLRERDRHPVELQRDRLGVESPGRVEPLGLAVARGQEHRAVGHRAQLAGDLPGQLGRRVAGGAVDLRRHADGDRRLQRVAPPAARQQPVEPRVRAALAGVLAQAADPRGERAQRRARERGRERDGQVGVVEQRLRPPQGHRPQRGRERRPGDQRESLPDPRLVRRDAPARERLRGRHDRAVLRDAALPHEGLEQVRERDQLPGRAERAGRHHRRPAVVEAVGEEAAQLRADALVAAEEARQPQQHRPADHGGGQRRADPRGAPDEDRALQALALARVERPRGQVAEPGRDPVGRPAALEEVEQRLPAPGDERERRAVELDALAPEHDPVVAAGVELVVAAQEDAHGRAV